MRKKDYGGTPPTIPHEAAFRRRITHLLWLESLINVGCTFGPNDLPPETWDELIALTIERQYIDRVIDKRRDKRREEEQKANDARQKTGLPPPGGTIFPTSRPFK